jgi:glucose dehydrogenase
MSRVWLWCLAAAVTAAQSTEWPMYGHDAGGARFSPLKQVNTENVAKLSLSTRRSDTSS